MTIEEMRNGKQISTFFIVVILNLSCTNCNAADYNGIVIKATENEILLATDLSLEEYEEIKELSAVQIQSNDVLGDAYYGLIILNYDDAALFSPGDIVDVWIDGDVLKSYPLQARAKKVTTKPDLIN